MVACCVSLCPHSVVPRRRQPGWFINLITALLRQGLLTRSVERTLHGPDEHHPRRTLRQLEPNYPLRNFATRSSFRDGGSDGKRTFVFVAVLGSTALFERALGPLFWNQDNTCRIPVVSSQVMPSPR